LLDRLVERAFSTGDWDGTGETAAVSVHRGCETFDVRLNGGYIAEDGAGVSFWDSEGRSG